MQSQRIREWGFALVFLSAGILAQYVSPLYGVPAALTMAIVGLILIDRANNKESVLLNSILPTVRSDSAISLPDYSEEWGHFDKINEALIGLQSASLERARELTGIIQRELIYLDDPQIQTILDGIIVEVNQWVRFGVTPEALSVLITMAISGLSNRMHERYRRS